MQFQMVLNNPHWPKIPPTRLVCLKDLTLLNPTKTAGKIHGL